MRRVRYLLIDYAVPRDSARPQITVLDCEIGAFTALIIVTTQTPIEPRRPVGPPPAPPAAPRIHRVEVYWHTVTYKTVAVYLVLLFVIIIAGLYVAMPDWTSVIQTKLNKAIGNPELENGPIT